MPTGYTAGIIDGEITTFPQFAKKCMRAFGATMHMRDDSLDEEYTPQKVDDFYYENLEKSKAKLKEVMDATDEEILKIHEDEVMPTMDYHKVEMNKETKNKEFIEKLYKEVEQWNPPTPEHEGIKMFMKEQLSKTMEYDAVPKYHKDELNRLIEEILSADEKLLREKFIKKHEKDIKYYTERVELMEKKVEDANKWVTDLLESL
jgi:hypothetical protein